MNTVRTKTGQPTVDADQASSPLRRRLTSAGASATGLSVGVIGLAYAVGRFDAAVAERLGSALVPLFAAASCVSVAAFIALANLARSFELLGRKSALVLTPCVVVAFNWLAFLIWRAVQLVFTRVTP